MSQPLLSVPALPLSIVSRPAGSLQRKEGETRTEPGLVKNHLRHLAATRENTGACGTVCPQSRPQPRSKPGALPSGSTHGLSHNRGRAEPGFSVSSSQHSRGNPHPIASAPPQNPDTNGTWRPSSLQPFTRGWEPAQVRGGPMRRQLGESARQVGGTAFGWLRGPTGAQMPGPGPCPVGALEIRRPAARLIPGGHAVGTA